MTFTFEDLTTGAGIGSAAAFIVVIIQLLKGAIPGFFARVTGAAWVFILTMILYIAAGVVLSPMDSNGYLALVISWATCATASIGLYSAATQGIEVVRANSVPPVIGVRDSFSEGTTPKTPKGPIS